MSSPEIRKVPSTKKGSFGEVSSFCAICKAKVKLQRVMKITILHSPDNTEKSDIQFASFKYRIPLCEEHSGINDFKKGTQNQQVRVKLGWDQE